MAFCIRCGAILRKSDKFCYKCGRNLLQTNEETDIQKGVEINNVERSDEKNNVATVASESETQVERIPVQYYNEKITTFLSIGGTVFVVSNDKYAFNYYRKEFKRVAREQVDELKKEYFREVQNLDSFLSKFSQIYLKYRERLIDNAMEILFQAGIYDVSKQIFTEQHTKAFCGCAETVNAVVESFNLTIQANQERKIRNYSMLPGVVFGGGIGGLLAATVTNAVVNSIAESDIKNANVTTQQRQELFLRINVHTLFERVFCDYWYVFVTLAWTMKNRGREIWFPASESEQSAQGLFVNLREGRVPKEKEVECLISIYQLNPYVDDYYKYLIEKYGKTQEVMRICDFYGYSEAQE